MIFTVLLLETDFIAIDYIQTAIFFPNPVHGILLNRTVVLSIILICLHQVHAVK